MNKDYASILSTMMREDQQLILSIDENPKLFQRQNKKHIAQLRQILEEIKEPRISILGYNGALAAWLIVQHANYDVSFQRKYLNITKKLYRNNPDEVYKEGIAYLEPDFRGLVTTN